MKHIHPFPARMAPELALAALEGMAAPGFVLDPMSGSGTVIRQAAFAGHRALAFDVDPLAVLISRVCSRKVDVDLVECLYDDLVEEVRDLPSSRVNLPWVDESAETSEFVSYWFGGKQRTMLRKIAFVLWQMECAATRSERKHIDVLKLALSRTIIAKENGASLARDVSHSRPHKVREASDYDVLLGFERSVMQVMAFLEDGMPAGDGRAELGDARHLSSVKKGSVDLVVTSPPYLNAIDYLRGHKLSLVWLGYSIDRIRNIRAESIGAERAPTLASMQVTEEIRRAMLKKAELPNRFDQMIRRYAADIHKTLGEIKRVLKDTGRAVLVVGDSCLHSVFISNSDGVKASAVAHGLRLDWQTCRELPLDSRYLPLTGDSLSKRMRFENVLTFRPA